MIDGELLYKMLINSFTNLSHNINYLNETNVFPVSDNDTGSNMKQTFCSGITAMCAEPSFSGTFQTFVKGMLMGSRGNSGLILSQYFLGIYEYTKGKDAVSTADLCSAMLHAYHAAHKAVLNPVEGTMLTIMREGINRTLPALNEKTSIKEFYDILVREMFICVQETTNLMDTLRDNNVVDSGAVGFFLIFDGMKRMLHDDLQHFDCEQNSSLPNRNKTLVKRISFFRFCTEFSLRMHEVKNCNFYERLLIKRGDSIVITSDSGILKIHLHTNEPQGVINEFSKYGDFITKKVEDLFLTEEFERLKLRKHNGFAIIAFTYGEGNAMFLEQLGADIAFNIPFGHYLGEEGLKKLIEVFLKENIIIFSNNRETYDRLKSIQWYSNYQNMYVADSDGLIKNFFMLSSLIFLDEFKNVIKSLETFKKKRFFQANVKTAVKENRMLYTACMKDTTVTKDDFVDLLNEAAGKKNLMQFSAVVVFGGKNCSQKDIDIVHAHFENIDNLDFSYFDGQQYDYDFIIGAY